MVSCLSRENCGFEEGGVGTLSIHRVHRGFRERTRFSQDKGGLGTIFSLKIPNLTSHGKIWQNRRSVKSTFEGVKSYKKNPKR